MISVVRQCELLDLARSSFNNCSAGEDEYNLALMRLIDEEFTRHPFYGVRRMKVWLGTQGPRVNRKRVGRLMRLMGLVAIYPKPRLSAGGPDHKVYPYLISGVTVDRPDQAWAADITYIRLAHGFIYLVAIMDCPRACNIDPLWAAKNNPHHLERGSRHAPGTCIVPSGGCVGRRGHDQGGALA
jgi:putative transposase